MTQTQVQEQVPRRVPAGTLTWLEQELVAWQAEGRLDAATAAGIRARYEAGSRLPLARLLLGLGAAFAAVGVVWLVAANLDELSPGTRLGGVAALWLGATATAELLHERRRASGTVVAALRGLAAVAFGAVVFQAAQSLQVPAYDPGLVGVWAAGSLLHAYATAATVPLLVGIVSGTTWLVMTVVDRVPSLPAGALAVLLAGVLCSVLATVHQGRVLPAFARWWREVGALLALAGLFLASLPDPDGEVPALLAVVVAAAALVAAGVGAAVGDRVGRQESAASGAVVAAGLLATLWTPAPTEALLTGEALARSVVAIALYLLAAVWFAGLGVLRDDPALTRLATAALVLFAVVQSFAVFQPVLSGAALFLALGAVLGGTGHLVERGRRRLVQRVETGTGTTTEAGA